MPPVAPHTPVLMLQGTGSDVGKSLLAAGLCRAFARRGVSVRPFKPQNMSNNAAVTADGGEIGRAQALQARACGLEPVVDMNPILLKPQSEIGAQVIVQGRIFGNARAAEYYQLKPSLLEKVLESFERLADRAELVIVEGAGSASEVNLRAGDIANMGFAEAADVPVVLVADIDRGGVIASIVGTAALLPEAEKARLKGYVINRFRGDVSLFDSALEVLRERTGLESFGIVPFFADAGRLPAEDGMAVDRYATGTGDDRPIKVAVLAFPRISNFDDLDPLRAEPDVAVTMVRRGQAIPGDCDLVILPGSKATLADLAVLKEEGWDVDIAAHLRRGGQVLGLCGGYQMLGRTVADPGGIEGPAATVDGLGFLDVETELTGDKQLVEVGATCLLDQQIVRGYEMHVGQTTGPGTTRPMLKLDDGRPDGAVSADGKVMGCYVHGLFATDAFRHAFLNRLKERADSGLAYEAQVEVTLDALADHLEAHLDLDRLWEVACAR